MVPPVFRRSGRVVCHGKFSIIMLSSFRQQRRRASENDFAFIVAAERDDDTLVRAYEKCVSASTRMYICMYGHVMNLIGRLIGIFKPRAYIDKR